MRRAPDKVHWLGMGALFGFAATARAAEMIKPDSKVALIVRHAELLCRWLHVVREGRNRDRADLQQAGIRVVRVRCGSPFGRGSRVGAHQYWMKWRHRRLPLRHIDDTIAAASIFSSTMRLRQARKIGILQSVQGFLRIPVTFPMWLTPAPRPRFPSFATDSAGVGTRMCILPLLHCRHM